MAEQQLRHIGRTNCSTTGEYQGTRAATGQLPYAARTATGSGGRTWVLQLTPGRAHRISFTRSGGRAALLFAVVVLLFADRSRGTVGAQTIPVVSQQLNENCTVSILNR